ncbi:MAG: hypothetical protein KA142_12340, partial [Chromatiaceae bacterium]|nr:hypothetical protein [Chromatiaceae bacterium]
MKKGLSRLVSAILILAALYLRLCLHYVLVSHDRQAQQQRGGQSCGETLQAAAPSKVVGQVLGG